MQLRFECLEVTRVGRLAIREALHALMSWQVRSMRLTVQSQHRPICAGCGETPPGVDEAARTYDCVGRHMTCHASPDLCFECFSRSSDGRREGDPAHHDPSPTAKAYQTPFWRAYKYACRHAKPRHGSTSFLLAAGHTPEIDRELGSFQGKHAAFVLRKACN